MIWRLTMLTNRRRGNIRTSRHIPNSLMQSSPITTSPMRTGRLPIRLMRIRAGTMIPVTIGRWIMSSYPMIPRSLIVTAESSGRKSRPLPTTGSPVLSSAIRTATNLRRKWSWLDGGMSVHVHRNPRLDNGHLTNRNASMVAFGNHRRCWMMISIIRRSWNEIGATYLASLAKIVDVLLEHGRRLTARRQRWRPMPARKCCARKAATHHLRPGGVRLFRLKKRLRQARSCAYQHGRSGAFESLC